MDEQLAVRLDGAYLVSESVSNALYVPWWWWCGGGVVVVWRCGGVVVVWCGVAV